MASPHQSGRPASARTACRRFILIQRSSSPSSPTATWSSTASTTIPARPPPSGTPAPGCTNKDQGEAKATATPPSTFRRIPLMKKLWICVVCLLSILAVGSTLHAASPAPSVTTRAAVELDSFLATLAPAELPPADSPFFAASCTLAPCVGQWDCGPGAFVLGLSEKAFCLCHFENPDPRRR